MRISGTNRAVYGQFLKAVDKAAFWREHAEQIAGYEEAVRKLKRIHPEGFPTMKTLRERKQDLIKEWRGQKALMMNYGKIRKGLETAFRNVKAMLDDR